MNFSNAQCGEPETRPVGSDYTLVGRNRAEQASSGTRSARFSGRLLRDNGEAARDADSDKSTCLSRQLLCGADMSRIVLLCAYTLCKC